MSSDPPELGKGLFGYRKSAVNQIIADRDIMLRQAEGRVRAAESKVADLESELVGMRDRNTRMDEQLERLRQQLDALAGRTGAPALDQEPAAAPEEPETPEWQEEPAAQAEVSPAGNLPAENLPAEAPYASYGEQDSPAAEAEWPVVDQEWAVAEEVSAGVDAGVDEQPVDVAGEDALPYGAEVRLRDAAADEPIASAWMQTGPPAEDEEEDEVALASSGYGYEDYDADEQQAYTDFGPAEEAAEEAVAGSPSPFAQFPFTSDSFGQQLGEMSAGAGAEEEDEDEPVSQVNAVEPEAGQPEPAEEVPPPASASPATPATGVSQETADITNRFLTDELSGILAAAEESAGRIVERARATTQRQIARSNRVWREVQAEVSRFAAWRQEVEPVIRTVQSKVDGVRSEIEEVPERIRQALAPMADTISSIDADLAELAAASNPPLLLTPSGLESEGSDSDAWGLDADYDDGFEHSDQPLEGESYRQGGGAEDPGRLHAG